MEHQHLPLSGQLDIERMRRYWETGNDPDVVDVVEQVLSYTDFTDRDTVLLSCIESDAIAAVLALLIRLSGSPVGRTDRHSVGPGG